MAAWLAMATIGLCGVAAQTPPDTKAQAPTKEATRSRRADPFAAYEAGDYEQALAGFVERRVERPDDPQLQLNVGSAQYQLGDYGAAELEYQRATEAERARLRAEALYNLGNAAYRLGRLEEAVSRYQESLALAPDDEDAKYNLEFVQREIERRREQAQQRQQQPQQPPPDSGEQQQEQQQSQPQGEPDGQDSDRDGLSDRTERGAENPTDPANPDTDGDGRQDGEEDRNRNGKVDSGETDPNQPDLPPEGEGGGSDQPQDQGKGQSAPQPTGGEGSMTPEEAARYLQGLEEKRPADPGRRRAVKRAPGGKPW